MVKVSSGSLLRGQILLPASKSISNRALLINALSRSALLPENLSDSDDTQVMLRALKALSGSSSKGEKLKALLFGKHAEETIDIGAAGTAMRFLTAYLSVTPGEHFITGTERMKHRPISILVDALRQLGATITYEGEAGFPPLRIVGCDNLEGGLLTVAGNVSSQYISALLMIAPTLQKGLRLTLTGAIASRPYLDMTIAMMRDFGAKVEWKGDDIIEVSPGPYRHRPYTIESDWSAASYWYEMVALTADEAPSVTLPGLFRESLQGDSAVGKMFRPLGVETTFTDPQTVRLTRTGNPCRHLELDLIGQPDLAQTLIVCCAMLGTTFRFSGLASLKIKETNRTAALQAELRKLGIVVREDGDSTVYWDGERCAADANPTIDTYEDHRMAMAFAPVSLRLGAIEINNPQVVSKSYPAFWDNLKEAGFEVASLNTSPKENDQATPLPPKGAARGEASWCCGQHEVCEKDSLRAIRGDIDYYEDEELDRFRGRTAYSEEEVEEFREVLYTMRTDEVAGWVHSLELRQVNLPDELKDEVLLIVGEQRQ